MKKIKIMITLMFIFVFLGARAQNYKTGIGLRLGGQTSGLTFRGFINSNSAVEGIGSFGHQSFILTGLYEKFNPVSDAAGLQWFYGGGAHLGFFRYGGNYRYYKDNDNGKVVYVENPGESNSVFGVDVILGMDYKFNNAPINLGLDIKPFIDFFDGTVGYFDGALSFRFVF